MRGSTNTKEPAPLPASYVMHHAAPFRRNKRARKGSFSVFESKCNGMEGFLLKDQLSCVALLLIQ